MDNLEEKKLPEKEEAENKRAGQEQTEEYKQLHLNGMYENWFLDYASYVILERAVPDIADGLNPVQRRIMHAMKEMDDGRFNKVANIIGTTMQFHPHGDAAIGDPRLGAIEDPLVVGLVAVQIGRTRSDTRLAYLIYASLGAVAVCAVIAISVSTALSHARVGTPTADWSSAHARSSARRTRPALAGLVAVTEITVGAGCSVGRMVRQTRSGPVARIRVGACRVELAAARVT